MVKNKNIEAPAKKEFIVATVTGGNLNVRSDETKDSSILKVLPDGTEIEITKQGKQWTALKEGGYVMTKFLNFK